MRSKPGQLGTCENTKKGGEITLTVENQRQYETILKEYEPNRKGVNLNEKFVLNKDYYFVLGDNRHNALDSRYIGFVPGNHLKGIMSLD